MTEPIHDPLCPQQPRADGATLEMRNGKVVYCGCDLIAEVITAAVQRVEALKPMLWMTKREGGYDCCGCNTLDELYEDCIAAIKGDSND